MNSVKNTVDWWWNNSRTDYASCSYFYDWLGGSGWSKESDNFSCQYVNSSLYVKSSSYVHYKNPYFCGSVDTHTYYDRNNVEGSYTGVLSGWATSYVNGGCESFLHKHDTLVRTT